MNGHSTSGADDSGKRWVAMVIEDIDFVGEVSKSGKTKQVSYIKNFATNVNGQTVTMQLIAHVPIR